MFCGEEVKAMKILRKLYKKKILRSSKIMFSSGRRVRVYYMAKVDGEPCPTCGE